VKTKCTVNWESLENVGLSRLLACKISDELSNKISG